MALVPPAVVTVTAAGPAAPAGAVAVRMSGPPTATDRAGTAPKRTVDAVVKPDPLTVTGIPPASGPASGAMEVTAGAGW